MKKRVATLVIATAVVVLVVYLAVFYENCGQQAPEGLFCDSAKVAMIDFISDVRGDLFAGFLALAGFLLSLKTFIVVTMKDKVYDHEGYRRIWEAACKSSGQGKAEKLHAPLQRLSDLLFYAILFCTASAISQMTVGFLSCWWASMFCVWTAAASVLLLLDCLWVIKKNLDTWFEILD